MGNQIRHEVWHLSQGVALTAVKYCAMIRSQLANTLIIRADCAECRVATRAVDYGEKGRR